MTMTKHKMIVIRKTIQVEWMVYDSQSIDDTDTDPDNYYNLPIHKQAEHLDEILERGTEELGGYQTLKTELVTIEQE